MYSFSHTELKWIHLLHCQVSKEQKHDVPTSTNIAYGCVGGARSVRYITCHRVLPRQLKDTFMKLYLIFLVSYSVLNNRNSTSYVMMLCIRSRSSS